ncbi:alpha/beta hydrolase [Streptomyces sp. PsTaAH-124]|uniref:alpha/beta hydrolase n=1 Tax=Streptomyces sp. PsTaAH-124 TaxID=1157638 RepID=UPI0018F88376
MRDNLHRPLPLIPALRHLPLSPWPSDGRRTERLFSRQGSAIGWDTFHRAEVLLTQPLCVVVGDKPGAFGAYRDGLEIYRRAASKGKELVVAEDFSPTTCTTSPNRSRSPWITGSRSTVRADLTPHP